MNNIQKLFHEKGVRSTVQRMLVYKALMQIGHATVDEVATLVRTVSPTISLATIYNIMETLSKYGIISKLYTENNKLFYDINSSSHHHLWSHEEPSKVVDYDDKELTELIMSYLSKKHIEGFEIEAFRLNIIGRFAEKNSD